MSIRQAISVGFGMAAWVGMVTLAWSGEVQAISSLHPSDIFIATGVVIFVQYGFFHLFKLLDSQRASLLGLARMPWAAFIEFVVLGVVANQQQLISGSLVMVGSVLLLLDSRRPTSRES